MSLDNESWIIEAGDHVIEKRYQGGADKLTQAEALIYCLWVADYGMRNAGGLSAAEDLYEPFQREAVALSAALELPAIHALFSQPRRAFEKSYFEVFDVMCEELRSVQTG